jgi:hypothetical protein
MQSMESLDKARLALSRSGVRPTCVCGRPVRSKGRSHTGLRLWGRRCGSCYNNGYTRFKKDYCEECGFVAIHRVQLDVDHIDGNHMNNDESNLQTLCANCHRLKTQVNSDHMPIRGQLLIINNGQLELNLNA